MSKKRANAIVTETISDENLNDSKDLAKLLNKSSNISSNPTTPFPSVALALISSIDEAGEVRISLPDLQIDSLPALSICAIDATHIGQQCAVQFINGKQSQALIIGMIIAQQQPKAEIQSNQAKLPEATEYINIKASEEILLECGESHLRMTADGVIEIRGVYISSDALATQRLRGGSVQVN